MVRIRDTPFKSSNTLIGMKLNRRIRGLEKTATLNKRNILVRNVRDKIQAKDLPRVSPGAIE